MAYPAFQIAIAFYQPVVAIKPAYGRILSYGTFEIQVLQRCKNSGKNEHPPVYYKLKLPLTVR